MSPHKASLDDSLELSPTDGTGSIDEQRYDEVMDKGEIKSRVAVASVLFALRSGFLQLLGVGSSVLLAHLLTPADFGIVAIGFTLNAVGRIFTDAGMGMALVRRAEAPTASELRAVTGYQVVVSLILVGLAVGVTLAIGGHAIITAFMMLSLPILALRTPGILYLDRVLDFRVRVRVEVGESLAYFVWVCTTALVGWGAWSIASALVVQSCVGALLVILLAPTGFLAPRISLGTIRPLFSFGLRFQAFSLLTIAHDLSLVAGIGAVGGLPTLGLWSFAGRLLTIPQTLYGIFLGLGTPAYSRLLHAGDKLGATVARSTSVLGVAAGVFLGPLAGCGAALIPAVFSSKWNAVAGILPGCCFALCLGAPFSICILDALFAAGDASTPLRVAAVTLPIRLVASLVGLHLFGVDAVGYAWALAQLVALPLALPRAHRLLGHPVGVSLVAPTLAFSASAVSGWVVVHTLTGNDWVVLAVGAVGSLSVFVAVLAIIGRPALRETVHTATSVMRATRQRSAQAVAVAPAR